MKKIRIYKKCPGPSANVTCYEGQITDTRLKKYLFGIFPIYEYYNKTCPRCNGSGLIIDKEIIIEKNN